MVNDRQKNTKAFLSRELEWLLLAVMNRFQNTEPTERKTSFAEIERPNPSEYPCPYTDMLEAHQMTLLERFALIMALAPHLDAAILELLNSKNGETGKGIVEFGIVNVPNSNLVMPSGQTLVNVCFGRDFVRRLEVMNLFDAQHKMASLYLIDLGPVGNGEPALFGTLIAKQDLLDVVFSEKPQIPRFGADFPARVISTELEWEDLVLDAHVQKQLDEIRVWQKYYPVLRDEWGMKSKLKPGYKALFFGPPGTGKTMCASLLGKFADQEVLRIDLSMIVSKYIGETEKNLSKIFDAAERRNWILFFDEADALFGKRTKVQDSHDRYANQEVSYLLQRVEEYSGLVLLATNLRSNMDDAFIRRFQTIIHFQLPRHEERLEIWLRSLPQGAILEADVDLAYLAMNFEMSGGSIVNAVHYACLQTAKAETNIITKRILLESIRREYHKEGKTI